MSRSGSTRVRATKTIQRGIACGFALGFALLARAAAAQIHADVGAYAGIEKRFLTAYVPGRDAGFGPTVGLSAHLAILPLLRAGAYVQQGFSPVSGEDTREITSAGLSLRLLSPWPRGVFRPWFAAGFGYAGAYAPSYAETLHAGPGGASVPATVEGAGGGFFEVPLGIGASLRLGRGWELVFEAGARIGFRFVGTMYNQGPTVMSSELFPQAQRAAGDDVLDVFLVVGVAYEL